MVKFGLLLGGIALSSALLVGCGSDTDSKANDEKSNKTETVAKTDTKEKKVSFKNDTLTINDAVIKLTGSEFADPNTEYGEDKPTLILTYDYTNTSKEAMEPSTVFIACFGATQETETTIEDLDIAMSPQDPKYAKMNEIGNTKVKPGATVSTVISYEIKDKNTPITLTASQGVMGDKLGTKTYQFK
ncbi:DUF5067 domain-containing protein [Listeria booriae]|uniref:DUF5067 domain-containing protein n=1 Tax=Listeria booriae TaxID=1552123 RepID=UPI001627DF0B|nr:DUF5067 domain-containing protein [Listeria booriae]MBC2103990.1 DUF5067 domain-containing protein [Listeria booriae]